jgi:acetoacetyl-CoA synthetase
VTFFGAGAAFYANCMKAGMDLAAVGDLRRVRALGTTGSPLSQDVQNWGTAQFREVSQRGCRTMEAAKPRTSGGATSLAAPTSPAPSSAATASCRRFPARCSAGCSAARYSLERAGEPVIDAVGELVCTEPIPSMPLYLWGDTATRYLSSYFDMYPGPGRHGDWLKVGANGGCVDLRAFRRDHQPPWPAHGHERVVQRGRGPARGAGFDGGGPRVPGARELHAAVRRAARGQHARRRHARAHRQAIRTALSPRFVPDAILQVAEIPRTLSGKKQELPIKKLLLGQPLDKVVNREAMANPGCLDWYVAFAEARTGQA